MHWCSFLLQLVLCRMHCCKVFLLLQRKNSWFKFVFDTVDLNSLNYLNYRLESNCSQTYPPAPPFPKYSSTDIPQAPSAIAHLNPDSTFWIIWALPLLPRASWFWKAGLPFQ